MPNSSESTAGNTTESVKVRRLTVAGLLAVLLAVTALVGARLHERLQPVAPPPTRPLAVETQRLEPQRFVNFLHVTGTLEAERRVVLSAQLAARVEEVPLREGARIARGDILVRLDESEQHQEVAQLEAAVDRVAADLAFWREQLQVDRRLLKSQTISRRAFDETQRQVTSLSAALRETRQSLQSARIRLEFAVVRAPFDGYVQTVHVLPGEFVQPGAAMVEVLAAEPLKAVVSVAEVDLQHLRLGQTARIRVPAVGEESSASVDRIYPGLERGTRSATVELFLSGGLATVRPGMAVAVGIELSRTENALVVPRQAVRERAGDPGVYVLDAGVARWRPVRTGAAQGDRVVVLSGLQAGDELIATPHPQLADARQVVARNQWRSAAP